ncbi:MAG: AAA family ATPase [Acidobacteria bacterium]|nr:AAA family ATPase [Acidobacteriota bacterium]MBI3657154.1 AAA family ATPase [Acidobacteriota bacterium]
MSWTLSITGKGGVGKTTLAALAVRWLTEHGPKPILAVDADPNTCLDALLGVKAPRTVGGVREEAKQLAQSQSANGMGKAELLDMKIQETLVEAAQFDLIAMGRPEGPGCYCYANNVLRSVLARIANQYPAVIIDNEAGLENLSRRTVQRSDWLVFVTDASARGLATARRLYDMALELAISAQAMGVVINRMRDGECLDRAQRLFEDTPVALLGGLPDDAEVAARDAAGQSVFGLSVENAVYTAGKQIFRRIRESDAVRI